MTTAPARCIACGDSPVTRFATPGFRLVRSPGCGLEWRDPFPDADELRALYGAPYLARWGMEGPEAVARVRAMKRATYRPILAELRHHGATGRLLDVGCALGFLVELASEQGFDAYGIDRNPDAIRRGQETLGARLARGELEDGPFPGVRFDVVTLVDVLEHVPEPGAALAAVQVRLREGGLLAAVLPNAQSLLRMLLGRRWPHYAPEHLFHWTPASLVPYLEARGFAVCALHTGLRKTYTGDYLAAYAASVGAWLPPGARRLGSRTLRVPTGEMLVVARRR